MMHEFGGEVSACFVSLGRCPRAATRAGPSEVFDLRFGLPALLDDIDDIGNERLRTRLQDIVI